MARSFTEDSITKDLKATGVCNIPGVGKFAVVQRPERKGTHPVDGREIIIPAKKAVTFKPSSTLKKEINS
jgi:nucleoid DNA-binding protein